MVIDNTKTMWKCPYCQEKYDNEMDAESCIESCADTDEPEEVYIEKYECEMCHQIFNEYDDAKVCEEKHMEHEDKHWQRYNEIESKKRLEEAAKHPNQTKIENYK